MQSVCQLPNTAVTENFDPHWRELVADDEFDLYLFLLDSSMNIQ